MLTSVLINAPEKNDTLMRAYYLFKNITHKKKAAPVEQLFTNSLIQALFGSVAQCFNLVMCTHNILRLARQRV